MWNPFKFFPDSSRRTAYTTVIFLTLTTLYVLVEWMIKKGSPVTPSAEEIPFVIRESLLVLSVTTGMHLLDRLWLSKDTASQIELSLEKVFRSSRRLLDTSDACGLMDMFSSRREAREEILSAVQKAEKRVWLLGIAFAEAIQLEDILSQLGRKKDLLDVKIVLLDPLRSTGVFWAFLEASARETLEAINSDRNVHPRQDPIFDHRLYSYADNARHTIERSAFADSVRFYGHSPLCWMVLVDDTAYYQPYTFGRQRQFDDRTTADMSFGDLMPLFKFRKQVNTTTFELLQDHLLKLWSTSDTDSFHMYSRKTNSEAIIKNVFTNRHPWLRHVYFMLNKRDKDNRKYPRQPCQAKIDSLFASWKGDGQTFKEKVTVLNSSKEGICLQFEDKKKIPPEHTVINVESTEDILFPPAAYIIRTLQKRCHQQFEVKWQHKTLPIVGVYAPKREGEPENP